jgi:hypothetical protein
MPHVGCASWQSQCPGMQCNRHSTKRGRSMHHRYSGMQVGAEAARCRLQSLAAKRDQGMSALHAPDVVQWLPKQCPRWYHAAAEMTGHVARAMHIDYPTADWVLPAVTATPVARTERSTQSSCSSSPAPCRRQQVQKHVIDACGSALLHMVQHD